MHMLQATVCSVNGESLTFSVLDKTLYIHEVKVFSAESSRVKMAS